MLAGWDTVYMIEKDTEKGEYIPIIKERLKYWRGRKLASPSGVNNLKVSPDKSKFKNLEFLK